MAGLIGLVYGLCAGVILAAYHEFGNRSLLDPAPLVAADPRPVKSLRKDDTPDTAAISRMSGAQGANVAALADADPVPLSTGEIRPATARWPDAEPVRAIDRSAAPDGSGNVRDAAEPDPAGDELTPEEPSVAAAPETAFELDAAVLPEAAPVVTQEPLPPESTAALPPTPAFKPLDVITTVVAQAAPPAAFGAPEASRRAVSPGRPPRPSLKPVPVLSKVRPEPAREPNARAVAATGQTLPQALRAFWTNLKILLASAPSSSDFRGDSGGNGGGGTSATNSDRRAGGSGAGGASGSGGGSGAGGGSGSGGGSGTSGGSASSGDDGSGATSGGNSGRGGDNGGRGGRGDDDRGDGDRGGRGDGDRGGRGDGDRGGRGDGDRGGRGDGRGGGDDDDD